MRQNDWERTGSAASNRRRSTARAAPLHENEAGGVAVAIVLVSATLAIVLSTLLTTLF